MSQSSALTCAKCNYSLQGLAHNAPCPECGTSYAFSQSEAWEQRFTLRRKMLLMCLMSHLCVIRDVMILLVIPLGFAPCGIAVAAAIELALCGMIMPVQPVSSPGKPWFALEHGILWAVGTLFLLLVILVFGCLVGESIILSVCLGAYAALRTAAWLCAMLHARRQVTNTSLATFWSFGIAFTLPAPFLWLLAAWGIKAIQLSSHPLNPLALVAAWMLPGIVSFFGSIILLIASVKTYYALPPRY